MWAAHVLTHGFMTPWSLFRQTISLYMRQNTTHEPHRRSETLLDLFYNFVRSTKQHSKQKEQNTSMELLYLFHPISFSCTRNRAIAVQLRCSIFLILCCCCCFVAAIVVFSGNHAVVWDLLLAPGRESPPRPPLLDVLVFGSLHRALSTIVLELYYGVTVKKR